MLHAQQHKNGDTYQLVQPWLADTISENIHPTWKVQHLFKERAVEKATFQLPAGRSQQPNSGMQSTTLQPTF